MRKVKGVLRFIGYLAALLAALAGMVAYALEPDWHGWYPIGFVAFMILASGWALWLSEMNARDRQAWQGEYNSWTPEQKIEYHKRQAQREYDMFGANYHNNMAQTLIQDEIRKTKGRRRSS